MTGSVGIRAIAPEENCSPVRVRVRVRFRISFKVGGQFSSGAIVLEPLCQISAFYDLSGNIQKR